MIDLDTKEQVLAAIRDRKLSYKAAVRILRQLKKIEEAKIRTNV